MPGFLADPSGYVQRFGGASLSNSAVIYLSTVRPLTPLIAISLALVSAESTARADFKEWSFTFQPSYAVAYVDSRTANGGGGAASVGFGVHEALTLHLDGALSWHALDATKTNHSGTLSVYSALVGLTYTLDVIRLVPSFDVAVGAFGLRGSAGFGSGVAAQKVASASDEFAVRLGFAFDYLLTRHWAMGVAVYYLAPVTDISRIPVYLYVGPRVTFRLGG